MEIVLKLKWVKKAIHDENVDEVSELQARLVLLETMDEAHRGQVRGCSTAKQIMERLDLIYADKSTANLYMLLHQYFRYTKRPEDSISVHVGKKDAMRNALKDLGQEQTEEIHQVVIIASLPAEFSSIMEIWELTHKDMRTTPNLVTRLLKREDDLKEGQVNQVLQMKRAESKKNTNCHNCGKKGHWWAECPEPKKLKKTNLVRTEVNFNTGVLSEGLKNAWVVDSGATAHMSNSKDWFTEFVPTKPGETCVAGDGHPLKVQGKGVVYLGIVRGARIKLHDVLFIPSLSTNLISVGCASEKGIISKFEQGRCSIYSGGVCIANKETLFFHNFCASEFSAVRANSRTEEHSKLIENSI